MGETGITGSVGCTLSALSALSALTIAAKLTLPEALPTRFGGPDIGAGPLFSTAIAAGVVGPLLLFVDLIRGRRTD